MLHVVFDTNVLVSSLIRRRKPRELWNKVLEGKIKIITSDELLAEFSEVIVRPHFKRYLRRSRLNKFHRILLQKITITKVKTHLPKISEDPDDNMVEAAFSAGADYIVSGDKHLLALKEFKGIKIVTIDEMVQVLTATH